jgi:hypothetical protein
MLIVIYLLISCYSFAQQNRILEENKARKFIKTACLEIGAIANNSRKNVNYKCEVLFSDESYIYFQIRNAKPKGSSGLVGNYKINKQSLLIETDMGEVDKRTISSHKLRRLTERLKK